MSGGIDSSALLLVFSDICKKWCLHLTAFHLDHHLRGVESDADRELVTRQCAALDVPLTVAHHRFASDGPSIQNEARKIRRRLLIEKAVQNGAQWIVTAHHIDDQAETFFIQLFNGAGLKGLSGMAPRDGQFIKPFLCFTRDEIAAFFMGQNTISYREDASNARDHYTRNHIRRHLLPMLKKNYKFSVATLIRQMDLIADAESLLEEFFTREPIHGLLVFKKGRTVFPLNIFLRLPRSFKYRLLLRMLDGSEFVKKKIHTRVLTDIIARSEFPSESTVLYQDPEKKICAEGGELIISPALKISQASPIKIKNGVFLAGKAQLTLCSMKFAFISLNKLKENLFFQLPAAFSINEVNLSRALPDDVFFGVGASGSKKVNRYLIDRKLPRSRREQVLKLHLGSEIIALFGINDTNFSYFFGPFIAESFKISAPDSEIYYVEIGSGD